jgi:signal transduction histidine kinase
MQAEALRIERERTLVDLGTEKSRIHAIIEAMPTGIVVTNSKGAVVLMNPVFRSWFQNEKKDFPPENGMNISHYIPDGNLRQFMNDISTGKYSGKNIPACEVTLSNETYFLAKGQEVLGKNGDCLGAVVIFNDITDLKNFDQQKSEFVAKVSHELRSPLSTIHEQLASVYEEAGESIDSENRYLLNRAREKTEGLIALIGDLLDLSRIEAGNDFNNAREINIIEQIDNIVDFLTSRAASKNQTLSLTHKNKDVPAFFADPMSIESIFGNLITNAIKYTPKNGAIQVVTGLDGNNFVVSVSDNGYGMEEAQKNMIFQKFYRIKTEKTRHIVGTGLGLAIVLELVESLGGNISVKSVPDAGSTFTVTIPLNKC